MEETKRRYRASILVSRVAATQRIGRQARPKPGRSLLAACQHLWEQTILQGSITHFEIYGDEPGQLAAFYRETLGWSIEQMPGLNYFRINTGANDGPPLHGGLTYRAIDAVRGWMLFVNVADLDEALAKIANLGGSVIRKKTAVPRTAWVAVVADPCGNSFGVWQADPHAFPAPEPD